MRVKLSVLIPVYNERYLVRELIRRVLEAPLPDGMERELVVVDDGSTDGSREILEKLAREFEDGTKGRGDAETRGRGETDEDVGQEAKSIGLQTEKTQTDGTQVESVIRDPQPRIEGASHGQPTANRGCPCHTEATLRYIPHAKNAGKGAAIRTAIAAATGDFCIFQDADLEYSPSDYGKVLAPLISGQADVVYGSRFLTSDRRRVLYYWHSVGNRMLTMMSNIFSDLNLTDMETCYKAFRTPVLKSIPIRSKGFGLEPEITAKIAKRGLRVYEVPINYDGRTYLEGKKITWKDGVRAFFVIFKCWLIDDLYEEKCGHDILASISKAHRFNRWMADVVVRPYMGHRVLEIGAGIGNMTVQLLPRERYVASEPDPLHLDVLRSLATRSTNLEARGIDAEKADDFTELESRFDTVVCLNVLEHLKQPDAALKNMYASLEPGGRLIILVPQGPWLFGSLDKAVDHVQRYTPKSLSAAVTAAGFQVEKTFHFNRIGVPGWFLNGRIFKRTKMAKYQLKLYDSLVWLWRRMDWLLPWHGLSIVAVATKPQVPHPALGEPAAVADSKSVEPTAVKVNA
ncbi:MAG TPA: bifunctional glycosyltransferase/class I SAM-dependent methyltransferase [Planctomycetota bacterium]|jgi:glycosyltransferase involved in cell wall biosynthesis